MSAWCKYRCGCGRGLGWYWCGTGMVLARYRFRYIFGASPLAVWSSCKSCPQCRSGALVVRYQLAGGSSVARGRWGCTGEGTRAVFKSLSKAYLLESPNVVAGGGVNSGMAMLLPTGHFLGWYYTDVVPQWCNTALKAMAWHYPMSWARLTPVCRIAKNWQSPSHKRF